MIAREPAPRLWKLFASPNGNMHINYQQRDALTASKLTITFLSEINNNPTISDTGSLTVINLLQFLWILPEEFSTIIFYHSLSNPRHVFLVLEKNFVSVRQSDVTSYFSTTYLLRK